MMKLSWQACLALTVLVAVEGSLPSPQKKEISGEAWKSASAIVKRFNAFNEITMPDVEDGNCIVSQITILDKLEEASSLTKPTEMSLIPAHTGASKLASKPEQEILLRFPKLLIEAKTEFQLWGYMGIPKTLKECRLRVLEKWAVALGSGDVEKPALLDEALEDLLDDRLEDYGKRYNALDIALDVILPWRFKIMELEMQYKVVSELVYSDTGCLSRDIDGQAKRNAKTFRNEIGNAERALQPKVYVSPEDASGEGNVVDKVDVTVAVEDCRKFCEAAANHLLDLSQIQAEFYETYDKAEAESAQQLSLSRETFEEERTAFREAFEALKHARLVSGPAALALSIVFRWADSMPKVGKAVQKELVKRLEEVFGGFGQDIHEQIQLLEDLRSESKSDGAFAKNPNTKGRKRRKGKKLKGKKKGRHVHRR